MTGCLSEALLELVGPWLGGGVFLLIGIYVLTSAPGSEHPPLTVALGLLLLHTSAVLIVGIGLKKATRFLAISWVLFMLTFMVVGAVLYG